MADRVYVPGFGYVTQGQTGTSGEVRPGPKPFVTGQEPTRPAPRPTSTPTRTPSPAAGSPHAALGVPPSIAYTRAGAPGAVAGSTTTYTYPSWTQLTQRERNLYISIAEQYNPNSTGKAWYRDDFLPYVRDYQEQTGIAIDPEYVAIQFAQQSGYDIRDYFASNPSISPTSVLFNPPEGGFADTAAAGSTSYGGGGGGYGGGGGGASMGSVSLTDPTSARGLLMQTMQSVLGRNPTSQEYDQFIKALSQAEMGAPQTVGFEDGLTVQSGGVNPSMVAMEYVEGLEEFNSAAGQRTLDAFMQVLGA